MKQRIIGYKNKEDASRVDLNSCNKRDGGASYYHNKQSKLSLKKKLAIAIPTITASLATLALVLFPTANQLASALTITSVDVSRGPVTGQNEVTIHGSGFLAEHKDSIKQISGPFILTNDGKVLFAPAVKSDNAYYYDFEHTQDITDKFKPKNGDKIVEIDRASSGVTHFYAVTSLGEILTINTNGDYNVIDSIDNITNIINLPAGEKAQSINQPAAYYGGAILSLSGRLYKIDYSNDSISGSTDVTKDLI